MSEHAAPIVKPADDPAFQLPSSLAAIRLPLLIGGLIALVAGWGLATFLNGSKVGMSAYLVAFIYSLTLAVGSLFFVIIQHLVRAGWSVVVRRVAELFMMLLIPLAVLFLPILASVLFGTSPLYVWTDETYAAGHGIPMAVWMEKLRWLDPFWFTVRSIVYFAVWIGLATFFYRGSVRQDETGGASETDRMQYWSGPAAMAFSLTTSFAAFDWIMSLAPMWFSTMFGVYLFAGSILSAHCVICLTSYLLQKTGAMRDEVTVEHYHDLGKLIFGFVFFWTYISFSQYLLIWYGNIPEETEWFYHRQIGAWGVLSLVIIFFHFIIPFAGTMSRHIRRRPPLMAFWSAYLLIMHAVDIYWMIMPEAKTGADVGVNLFGAIGAAICIAGMAALSVGCVLTIAQHVPVTPVRDPRFRESLAFENM